MYLKKLEIQGFKSFAEKIALEFNSGITSVVGPNGSGKSNIADAVRWVLGEQSIKTLRGGKMEDVIFAGTENRKPMGFAEVSLTIDNSDNSLPIAYTEVTITRRIFRSGESEYFINKTQCRLKDITELFLDTGIGKEGYSIIGQGRIDEILSTKSEDRRHIFEEASGIMKYKMRKIEAEKKLEQTKQNLLRINDIINELENQLEPLRQQSETAKKYLSLREALKELEVNVYIENIGKFKEKISELEGQYTQVKENIDNENLKLVEITENNQQKTSLLKSLEEKINGTRDEFYVLEGNIERCNSDLKLNEEKKSNLEKNIQRIDEEITEINQKVENLEKDEETKNKKIEYLNARLTEYSSKLSEAEKKMEEILSTLGETERHIEDLKAGIMDKLDIQSDKKTQINNVKSHIELLAKRQNTIDNEIRNLILEKDKEGMLKEDLAESVFKAKEEIRKSKSETEEFTKERNELDTKLAELKKVQNDFRSEIQFKTSRVKMLQDMEKNLEGYNRSVRSVLMVSEAKPEIAKGIHGALAQLIKVEKKYETAIEMALGNALQNLVASTEEDAKRAIEYLKQNRLGRATFLPISAVKGRSFDDKTISELKRTAGFCGVASDLVTYDNQYSGIILNLLGKVAVVENMDAGIRIARNYGYSFKIVTIEGDIINSGGSMTGGSIEGKGTGILGRSREIGELQTTIKDLEEKYTNLGREIGDIILKIESLNKNIALLETKLKDNELIRLRDENHIAQVENNIQKCEAKIEMMRQEKNQLGREAEDTRTEMEKYEQELSVIENEITEAKGIVTEYQEKHKEGQTLRDNLYRDISDYKISVNSIVESIEGVREDIGRISGEKGSSQKSIERKNAEKKKNTEEITSITEKDAGLYQLIKGYEEERAGKTFEIDRISEERKVIEEELYDIVNRLQEINKTIMLLTEDYNRIEVKKTKLESEMEVIQNRLWDEYELTYNNALEIRKDIGSITAAQKHIVEFKAQIKDLGVVNVAAIDEYVKTKERHEFMAVQRDDMEQAEEKLRKVITEMTVIMKNQFIEQFRLINTNFNTVFKELFGGGHAELKLTDSDNVLESGIEIEVQPPGKKLQNMMLLSGGERAFTAIALLFGILKLRPTPFCILDEIEAALDDANVSRFAQYLRNFSNNVQFAVVTHRKGTIEASDTLYGVTMQEHGISKVVSMKINEKAS
ncbi:MAG: chromosome segregation protein SMC [Bacillota bacterium]|nr:chromosome segregation protein SMC [Bacillota bacterium]